MNLERIEAENITGSDQLDALIYLAEYAKVCPHLAAFCTNMLHLPPHSDVTHVSVTAAACICRNQQEHIDLVLIAL